MKTKHEIDLTQVLPISVTRTLKETEVLCPECKGVGLVRRTDERGDYITNCNHCYGRGHFDVCPYCTEVKRAYSAHECEGKREDRQREFERKEQEKWNKAEKISLSEACKRFDQVLVDWDTYLPPDMVIEHIADAWIDGDERVIPRVWGTMSESLKIDASHAIENSIQDLHEDAEIDGDDESDLQTFLDEWCNRESVINSTLTYYPDEKVAIVITEDEVLEEYPELLREQAQANNK